MKKTEKAAGHGRKHGKDGRFVSSRKTAVKEKAAEGEEKPLRPSQCRGHLRRELANSFRGIVTGFVNKAKDGSVQHVKLATELLEEPGTRKRGKGSAALLLEKLRRVPVGDDADEEAEADVWRE